MKERQFENLFNKKTASNYDGERNKLEPIKDALHLCMRAVLSDLPSSANILCVGAGTGSELLYLAGAFPNWRFAVVEPSADMINICRQRAEARGIHSRCLFHEGYIDSLPEGEKFDAATSILVSHFIVNPKDRERYFYEIASRLKPEAYLINADLAYDMSAVDYKQLLKVWVDLHDYAEMPARVENLGSRVAMLPLNELEKIINNSGFGSPVLFYQSVFIHAWFSRVDSV